MIESGKYSTERLSNAYRYTFKRTGPALTACGSLDPLNKKSEHLQAPHLPWAEVAHYVHVVMRHCAALRRSGARKIILSLLFLLAIMI
jgi:hypothetical protein